MFKIIKLTLACVVGMYSSTQLVVRNLRDLVGTHFLLREGGLMDMFRSRRMKVSIATSFSSALFLLIGTLASGQAFSVADREVNFYKGGGVQGVQLEAATGVAAGTAVFYSAAIPEDTTVTPSIPAHASPTTGVLVPVISMVPMSSDVSVTRLAPDSADPFVHPTVLSSAYETGGGTVNGVTGVAPTGGTALTLETTLANLGAGEYHVSASPDFTVSIFNGDIGTATGNSVTFTISYTVASSLTAAGTTTDDPAGTAIFREDSDKDFDYMLRGGLLLKYEGMVTDANDVSNADGDATMRDADAACTTTPPASRCVGMNDPGDDYYTVDTSKPPTLWGNEGLTMTGKHTFTYQLGSSANGSEHDTLNYSALIVDPNVWGSTAATVEIDENETDLSVVNAVVQADQNSDGTAAADRNIEFSLNKGGNIFRVSNGPHRANPTAAGNTGKPVLDFKRNAMGEATTKIDYEASDEGMIEVEICASGDHVPAGTGADDAQCYTLNLMVKQVNEAPAMQRGKSFDPVYLTTEGTLPSSILLTDYFMDPEGDSLSMTLSAKAGTSFGKTTDTKSSDGGYDVTATIVGGSVLSFAKKLPEGEVLESGVHTYAFTIYANDGKLQSAMASYNINIKVGANTAPVWIGGVQAATWKIDENVTGRFSDSVSATDVDGDTLTYELVGQHVIHPVWARWEGRRIAGTCLRVIGNVVHIINIPTLGCNGFNFERGSTATFQISVHDNYGGAADPVTITVMIGDQNEPPAFARTGIPTQRIYKGVGGSVAVTDYASDPEGDDINFTCVSTDTSVVRVNTTCTSGATLTAVGAGSAMVRVVASNAEGSVTTNFNVLVKGGSENNPPAFANGVEAVSFSVNETMGAGSVGSAIGVSDPDEGDVINLETIPKDGKFGVSRTSTTDDDGNVSYFAQLSHKGGAANALDHETEPTIHFIVRADDDWEGRDYLRVTINVADVNEAPERTDVELEDVSVVENSTMEVDVSGLWTDEDEIDSDRLSITALVANPFVAEVTVNAQSMAIIEAHEPGETSVTLTARDSAGHTKTETFMVKVTSNNVPTVANAIDDMEINVSEIVNIDVSDVFADEDGGDVMVTGVESSNEDAVLAVLTKNNTSLAVIGASAGMSTITVSAADTSHAYVQDMFDVTVSEEASSSAPRVARELGDITVTADVEELLAIGDVFEGDSLSYQTLNTDPSIATLSLDGDSLKIMGHDVGSTQVSLIATNDSGRSSIAMFAVLVETMPTAVGSLPAVVLEVGAETFLVDFADSFIDRDGDILSYDVSIPDDHFIDWRSCPTRPCLLPH